MTMRDQTPAGHTGQHTVVGVFHNPSDAERALNSLRDANFTPEQVSVVAKDTGATRDMVERTDMDGAETTGAGAGAFLGGITGGVLGWLVGIGALAIPGIGPVVAAGTLATTLGGAAVGAVTGGLIGALVGAGVPEEHARGYEEHVRGGRILFTVYAPTDRHAEQAAEIFELSGATDVQTYSRESVSTPSGASVTP